MDDNKLSLLNIFYSNSPLSMDYQAVDELDYLIDQRLISASTNQLCKITRLHEIIDRINNNQIKALDYQGGGLKHMALKKLGEDLLLSLNKKVKIESLFNNRYPDLIADDLLTVIECGDTDPNKILEYFNDGVSEIIILPYPNDDELIYYKFITENPKELHQYIVNKNKYYNDKIKQIIKRR